MWKNSVAALAVLLIANGPAAAQHQIAMNIATAAPADPTAAASEGNGATVARYEVRVRNASTDQLIGSASASQAGQFSFETTQPAPYVVELIDAVGQLAGMSSSVDMATGATMVVTVGGTAASALSAPAANGRATLGPLANVAVSSEATTAASTPVVATRQGRLVVCHKLSDTSSQTLGINDGVRSEHLGHGDLLGACPRK